jgi:hypothetical protein
MPSKHTKKKNNKSCALDRQVAGYLSPKLYVRFKDWKKGVGDSVKLNFIIDKFFNPEVTEQEYDLVPNGRVNKKVSY